MRYSASLLVALAGQVSACAVADGIDTAPADEFPEALPVFTETYSLGTLDIGHWALTTNDLEPRVIDTSGGNPGGYLHAEVIGPCPTWSTASPRLTGGGDTVFVGNYWGNRIGRVSADLLVEQAGSWSASRTVTLQLLRWDVANDTIALQATFSFPDIPQVPSGWQHHEFPVDANSSTTPAGWELTRGDGTPASGAEWRVLMRQVDVVAFGLWKPGCMYPALGYWKLGIDNIHIGP